MDKIASALRLAAKTVDRSPTDAQKEAGNYRKGHVRLHGLDIAIENPKGGERSGVDKGGKRWSVKMPAHYGYVKRTEGKDGDAVDVYVGENPESQKVFVVDQVDASSGKFDEHKCCLGYDSKDDALADYEKAFSDGKAKDRIGSVTEMTVDGFKDWLKDGDTTKPMGRKAYATGGSVVASALRIAKKRAKGGAVSDLYGEDYKPDLGSDSEGDITTADVLSKKDRMYSGPGGALRSAKDAIPESPNTLSALNMVRSGLGTAANWLQGTPEIGPDTLAPLGLAPMGMALTPRNAVGVFGGPLAKTADHAALAKAQELAGKGVDRDFIWKETGWGLGPDGKWRFEIDDSGARYKPDFEGKTLQDAVTHPDLYGAYPEMAGMRAGLEKRTSPVTGERTINGYYSPEGGLFIHDELGTKRGRSTALHEIQHAAQDKEGFAQGANYDIAKAMPEYQAAIARLEAEKGGNDWTSVNATTPSTIVDDIYRRHAGEVEARNVQTRADYSPEQRRSTPPWKTQDVPDEQQIVRFGGSGPQMSSLPMDEASRLNRAREMGFDESDWYHGTSSRQPFESFDLNKVGSGLGIDHEAQKAIWISPSEAQARIYGKDGGVLPLKVRHGRQKVIEPPASGYRQFHHDDFDRDLAQARAEGYDSVLFRKVKDEEGLIDDQLAVFEPRNIRRRDAAFDPAQSHSANLLASDTTRSSVPGTVVNAQEERASGGSVGPNMHNPKIASALRIAGRYAEGGNVPLSDAGPLPDQEWPDTYDPQGGADFLGMVKDTGLGVARAIAPPIPGFNHPTLSEGTEALRSKVADKSQGEVLQQGLGEFAGEALPMVATSAFPLAGRALRAAGQGLARAPLTTGSAAAGLGMTALPGEAGDTGDPRKAEISMLEQRIEKRRVELQNMSKVKMQSTVARQLASQPIIDGIAADQQRIGELQASMSGDDSRAVGEAAAARNKVRDDSPKPFNEEFPTWSKYQPFMPAALGALTGLLPAGARAVSERFGRGKWQAAVDRAMNASSPAVRDRHTAIAKNYDDAWPKPSIGKDASSYTLPLGLGAVEGAIVPNLPEGYNLMRLGPENPERKAQEEYLRLLPEGSPEVARTRALLADETALPRNNPVRDASTRYFQDFTGQVLPRTGAGMAEGMGAAAFGNTMGKLASPGEKTLPRPQTKALVDEMSARASPQPIRQLEAKPSTTDLTPERGLLTGPPRQPERLPAPQAQTEPQGSSQPKQTSSSSESSNFVIRDKTKNGQVVFRRPDGKFTSKPASNKAPADEDPPFAHGGIVRSALRIARKFGGRIGKSAGLLKSDVPGRTDHIETSVKSGSFVIPADVVSHLGESNTNAGSRKLDDLLKKGPYGTSMPSAGPKAAKALSMVKSKTKFASGGIVDVPILAAGGEYVVSPEQVAILGGGDLDRGHQMLDQFVLDTRADHINTLQNLPGPQKD